MHPIIARHTGNSHDYTGDVVSAIDAIIDKLAEAKEDALKVCPYETEFRLFDAKTKLCKVLETVETVSGFYERYVEKEGE